LNGTVTTLTWQTTLASDVSIDGIGAVQPNGSQQVTPTDSTTYHLVAKVREDPRKQRPASP